nr:hypothetical protein HEP85_33895 [Streptomyces sp. RPA4-2]
MRRGRGARRGERSAFMVTTIPRSALHVVVPEQAMRTTADGVRHAPCPPLGGRHEGEARR